VFVQLHDTDDARCHAVGAVATASEELIGAPCNELNGGGGTSQAAARAAAIGETVERYSASYVDARRLRLGAARQLDLPTVAPERFEWFAEWQTAQAGFPFAPFTAATPVRWVEGFSLADGAPAWVPAQLVFLTPEVAAGEERVIHATSNGLACGPSPEEAVVSGLLELVERDAFMLTWYGQLSLPRIDISADPALGREVARLFGAAGLHHDVVDLSGFCDVPAALAVVRNDLTDSAVLAVGAGAATTMRVAVRKALVEAYQTRTWAKAEQRIRPGFSDGDLPLEARRGPTSCRPAASFDRSAPCRTSRARRRWPACGRSCDACVTEASMRTPSMPPAPTCATPACR
jgi:ribosomal protein S12 methylthiotransferase accessory factor